MWMKHFYTSPITKGPGKVEALATIIRRPN